MTNHSVLKATPLVVLTILSAACGQVQPVVTAEIEVEDPTAEGMTTTALADMEVELLPYDRDQIFDSLTSVAPRPEPEIPQELLAAQEEIAQAQQEWRDAENRWNTLRDSLQTLNTQLETLNRGESQYVALYREWQDLDRQYSSVEREMEQAFERFNDLQSATIAQVEEVRLLQDEWADEAFADYDAIVAAKLQQSGLDIYIDTTDASGIADFQGRNIAPGTYWVHARHELPYNELYWNEPFELVRGDPMPILLSRENADLRPIF